MNSHRAPVEEQPPLKFEELDESQSGLDEQPWLVSYADLMTLLFGFFALLFSFGTMDDSGMKKVTKALSKTFGTEMNTSKTVAENVRHALTGHAFSKMITVTESENELAVAFKSSLLFDSGKGSLAAEAEGPLMALIGSLKSQKSHVRIIVEGYTDDAPISTAEFKSNWELSSARAATIVHFLEAASFPPDHLEAVGFGSTRPVAPNRTDDGTPIPENQSRNRRVAIRIGYYE